MKVATRRATADDSAFARAIHHRAYREVVVAQYGPWDEAAQDGYFAAAWSSAVFAENDLIAEPVLISASLVGGEVLPTFGLRILGQDMFPPKACWLRRRAAQGWPCLPCVAGPQALAK